MIDDDDRLLRSVLDELEADEEHKEPVEITLPPWFWWRLFAIFTIGSAIGGTVSAVAGDFAVHVIDCRLFYQCQHWWGR